MSLERENLFPLDLPSSQWEQFKAAGFDEPVWGVIYRPDAPPCCGMPLGGVGTGAIDLDVRGVWGLGNPFNILYVQDSFGGKRGNIFKAPLTRKLPDYLPVFGLSLGDEVWVLADRPTLDGGETETCCDPMFSHARATVDLEPLTGTLAARKIQYWGHYPIADLEYELEYDSKGLACPLSVGVRAWSPFIPGDVESSMLPCAFFEVFLRNTSSVQQQGKLVFCFPGAIPETFVGELTYQGDESYTPNARWPLFPPPPEKITRKLVQHAELQAVLVEDGRYSYCMGVLEQDRNVGFAGMPGRDGSAWRKLPGNLPAAGQSEPGTAMVVDFTIPPGDVVHIPLLLSWYAQRWQGAGDNRYTNMYAVRYADAFAVAKIAASKHASCLARVLSWQNVIYREKNLPGWLRDALVNNLALIPETTYWAAAKQPLGDWCREDGFLGMLESPRPCPQIECNPCSFYGNLPLVYFFPQLARSQLQGYAHYMRPDGAIPFVIGSNGAPDMATPSYGWQISLNGPVYVILADRIYQRCKDKNFLESFYPSVKKSLQFTMQLNPSENGPISMPLDNQGMEWFEWGEWLGMCSHLGGVRLAAIKIAERMALEIGDHTFAGDCQRWFNQGSRAMEEKLWAGSYYLNFLEEETGKKSDVVMGYQLDGVWISEFHGVAPVFCPDRIPVVLETIHRANMPGLKCGALSFADPRGGILSENEKIVEYGSYFIFLPEIMILSMNYMLAGQKDFGLSFLKRAMEEMVCVQKHPWDLPNMIEGNTGHRHFGTDYYQNMMLWAVPAALAGLDLHAFCSEDGFIGRILKAGHPV